jgi:hypothetical protein
VAPDRGSSLAALTCDAASMAGGPDAASESETAPAEDECVTFFCAEISQRPQGLGSTKLQQGRRRAAWGSPAHSAPMHETLSTAV